MDGDALEALMSGMARKPDVSKHIVVVVKRNVVTLLNKASATEIFHLDVLADFKRRCNEIIYAWTDQDESGYEAQLERLTGSPFKVRSCAPVPCRLAQLALKYISS